MSAPGRPTREEQAAKALVWAGPALLTLGIAALVRAFASPDGVEAAAAGACLWLRPFQADACLGLEPLFWPPALPVSAGLLSFLTGPTRAALLVSLGAAAAVALPLALIARQQAGWIGAALAAPLILAVPALREQAMNGDARGLALLGLTGAWSLALALPDTRDQRRRGIWVGLALALAMLARPEALAWAAVLLGAVGLWRRPWLKQAAAAAFLPMLPYWLVISGLSGSPVLTSRGWQSRMMGWLSFSPMSWIIQEGGAGARATPLRAAMTTSSAAGENEAFALLDSAHWLIWCVRASVPAWLTIGAALGVWVCARSRKGQRLLLALAALAGPALLVNLLPQARDLSMPANNLQAFLLVLVTLTAIGVGWVAQRVSNRPLPLALALVAVVGWVSAWSPPWTGVRLHTPESFSPAAQWLRDNVPEDATVAATIELAPVVLEAGLRRSRVPSRFTLPAWMGGPERPDYVLVGNIDLPNAEGSLVPMLRDGKLDMAGFVSSDNPQDWVLILRFPDGDATE